MNTSTITNMEQGAYSDWEPYYDLQALARWIASHGTIVWASVMDNVVVWLDRSDEVGKTCTVKGARWALDY